MPKDFRFFLLTPMETQKFGWLALLCCIPTKLFWKYITMGRFFSHWSYKIQLWYSNDRLKHSFCLTAPVNRRHMWSGAHSHARAHTHTHGCNSWQRRGAWRNFFSLSLTAAAVPAGAAAALAASDSAAAAAHVVSLSFSPFSARKKARQNFSSHVRPPLLFRPPVTTYVENYWFDP